MYCVICYDERVVIERTYMRNEEQYPILALSWQAQQTIYADLVERPQIEACGVLLGSQEDNESGESGLRWHIENVVPLRNSVNSPVLFEFDPAELLQVEMEHSEPIVGVYHSHPTGYGRASSTDRQNMQRVNQEQQIPWCWLIVCGPFDSAFAQMVEQGALPGKRMIAYYHHPEPDGPGLVKLNVELSQRHREK